LCPACRTPNEAALAKRGGAFCLPDLPAGWACGPYRGALRRMILQAKLRPHTPAFAILKREFVQAVRAAQLPRGHLLAPPASRARRWQGWHLADELARALSRELGWPLVRPFRRIRERPPQAGLGAAARRANLQHCFAWRRAWLVNSAARRAAMRRVYFVDDVLTTGGTYFECMRLLAQLGVHDAQPLVLAWVPDCNPCEAAARS
jgi:predicted amidophosphoribosyltransferase